jgi:ComF family protein
MEFSSQELLGGLVRPSVPPKVRVALARRLALRLGGSAIIAASAVANLLIPAVCVCCRRSVMNYGCLCAMCWSNIDFIEPPICDRLGIPLPYGTGEWSISSRALMNPPAYDRARAVARYQGVMRDLVHFLKYGDQHHVVPLLARLMMRAGRELLSDVDMLVPVPLSRLRLWSRRFNQAAILAAAISKAAKVRYEPLILERVRHTASQVGLDARARKANVDGAFNVNRARRNEIKNRRIVLIDDVITTGATLEAATMALRRAGAQTVDVLSVAIVTGDTFVAS